MLDGFKLDLKPESRKLLTKMPGLIVPALFKGMKQAVLMAEATARSPYLSGKALNRRTGRLRNSITHDVRIRGNTVIGAIGTNVAYGRFWELGYDGPVRVKAHARTIKQAFGRAIRPTSVSVRSHTRQVSARPRPFLRPGLEDNMEDIRGVLAKRVEEAFA